MVSRDPFEPVPSLCSLLFKGFRYISQHQGHDTLNAEPCRRVRSARPRNAPAASLIRKPMFLLSSERISPLRCDPVAPILPAAPIVSVVVWKK